MNIEDLKAKLSADQQVLMWLIAEQVETAYAAGLQEVEEDGRLVILLGHIGYLTKLEKWLQEVEDAQAEAVDS